MDGHYLLVDAEGNATEVDGEIKIGRGKEVNIVLKDKLVSRHHATVWMEGETLMLRDEESVNGTFVNDEQIYEPIELKGEDKIRFGDEVLTVRPPLGEEPTVRDIRLPAEMETKLEMLPPELEEAKEEAPKESAYSSDFDEPGDAYEPVGDDMEEPAEGGGNNKKLLLIGLIVLLVLCCCVIVAGAGFWFYSNSQYAPAEVFESTRLLMALL